MSHITKPTIESPLKTLFGLSEINFKIHTLGKILKSLTCSEFPPSHPYAALPSLCLMVTSTAPSVFYCSSLGNDIQRPIVKNTRQQWKNETLVI